MRMHIIPHEDNKKGLKISQGWVVKASPLLLLNDKNIIGSGNHVEQQYPTKNTFNKINRFDDQ